MKQQKRWTPLAWVGLGVVATVAVGTVGWTASEVWPRPQADESAVGDRPQDFGNDGLDTNIMPPTRAAGHRSPTFSPPPLPSVWAELHPITVQLETRGGSGASAWRQHKTVSRTTDRIHVALGNGGAEWLFVRNAKDPRRMSATMIDHREGVIVEYDESELRMAGLGRGWADVVALGVDSEALSALVAAGESKKAFGYSFTKRQPVEASADAKPSQLHDVWWSDEAALPLRYSIMDDRGQRTVELRAVKTGVDNKRLEAPRRRFPTYQVEDIADHRERQHEHGER